MPSAINSSYRPISIRRDTRLFRQVFFCKLRKLCTVNTTKDWHHGQHTTLSLDSPNGQKTTWRVVRTCFKWKAQGGHLKACVPGLRVVSTSSFDPNSLCRWPAQHGRQTCSVLIQRSTRTCLRASAGSRNTEPEKMRRSGTQAFSYIAPVNGQLFTKATKHVWYNSSLIAQPLHCRKYPVPAKEGDRRRALENATKFLVVRHPLDRLVSSYLDKVPFSVKIIYWSQCVFVFAWLLVRLVFVLSCSKSKYNMIDWWLGFCDSKSFQGGRHDKGAEPAEAPRRKERNPGSGGKKFQGGRGAGHYSDNLTWCDLWSSPQETFAGAHLFRVRRLCCKRDNRTWKSKRLEGDELLIQNKGLSKK